MEHTFDDLRKGIVLAELGGYGDGPYCAEHGAGAALVMLGTYIIDPGDSVPYPPAFVFKPGRANYESYLREHVAAARAGGGRVGVSAISVALEHTVDFLTAAEEAGADYASLCVHSSMEMFVSAGLGHALCRRENAGRLSEWAGAIVKAVGIPVIFKIPFSGSAETSSAVGTIAAAGVPIVHVALGGCGEGAADLAALGGLSGACDFLIAGGGVRGVEDAQRILRSGVDAVAIGTAAMKDATLCGRIQRALRNP